VSSFAIHDPGRASETSLRRAFFEKRRVEMLGKSSEASETASTAQLEERYAHLHELDHQLSAEWAALSRVEKLAYAESRPWEDQLAAADAATAPDAKVFIVLSTARGMLALPSACYLDSMAMDPFAHMLPPAYQARTSWTRSCAAFSQCILLLPLWAV